MSVLILLNRKRVYDISVAYQRLKRENSHIDAADRCAKSKCMYTSLSALQNARFAPPIAKQRQPRRPSHRLSVRLPLAFEVEKLIELSSYVDEAQDNLLIDALRASSLASIDGD